MKKQIGKILRNVLRDYTCKQVLLFGSRARGDHAATSDFDLFAITKESIAVQEKMRLCAQARRELAQVGIDADIVIKSTGEIEYYRDKVGHVVKQALREGIRL